MPNAAPVVFLLDDDIRLLKALSTLLQCNGYTVRTFSCVDDFLKGHDPDCPGCLILDVQMPGLTGLELQNVLTRRGNALPIIFLTAHGDIRTSVQAMKAGAVTFLPKPVRKAELLDALEEALRVDAVERQRQHEQAGLHKKLATLTPREREVLDLIIAGKMTKQIALELCTAEKTVKSHRGHIMEKLQVRGTSALVTLFSHLGTAKAGTIHKAASKGDVGNAVVQDSLSPPASSRSEGTSKASGIENSKDALPLRGEDKSRTILR